MKKLINSVLRISLLSLIGLAVIFSAPSCVQYGIYPVYEGITKQGLEEYVKIYKPYTKPLKDIYGSNYCSSSTVSYKGSVYTVTNNHCCDVGLSMFGQDEVRVGDSIEKVLHYSNMADICVLTSVNESSPITLSEKEFNVLDPAFIMGYPRGSFLTPRFGHIVAKDEEVCLYYNAEEVCRPSNYVSTISYEGNSGSPVFNEKGQLTNVLFAGSRNLHTFSIVVPLFFVRAALDMAHGK